MALKLSGRHDGTPVLESVPEVIECKECFLIHRHPLPSEEEYRNKISNFYRGGSSWTEPSPEDREWMKLEFEAFRKMLSRGTRERTLVDVGCGRSTFLPYMEAHGWAAYGTDACPAAIRGVPGDFAHFFEDSKPAAKYGALSMISLLEHVLDPRLMLQKAKEWLRPHGVLLVKVPNDFSFLQLAALREGLVDRAWWVHEDHNYYFTPESLKMLLEEMGFDVLERTTSYPMEWALLKGKNYVKDSDWGKAVHAGRRNFDHHLGPHRDEFYERLARSGMGRHVIYLARKK